MGDVPTPQSWRWNTRHTRMRRITCTGEQQQTHPVPAPQIFQSSVYNANLLWTCERVLPVIGFQSWKGLDARSLQLLGQRIAKNEGIFLKSLSESLKEFCPNTPRLGIALTKSCLSVRANERQSSATPDSTYRT